MSKKTEKEGQERSQVLKLLDAIVKSKDVRNVVEAQLGLRTVPESGFDFQGNASQTVVQCSRFLDHLSAGIERIRTELALKDRQSDIDDLDPPKDPPEKPKRGPGRPRKKTGAAVSKKTPARRRPGRPRRSKGGDA